MQAEEIYSVDGLPPEWGGVVARFVKSHAERNEANDGREGEYLRTLEDAGLGNAFTQQAKSYSRALWSWATKTAPKEIVDWALGEAEGCPKDDSSLRLFYLLFRREQMAWWRVRGKLPQTEKNILRNAQRLKESVLPLLVARELDDIELFKLMVAEKRQTRHDKRPYELEYFLLIYWMVWSLWEGNLDTTIQNFEKRMRFTVSKKTLREKMKTLGLKMQKKMVKSTAIMPPL